MMVMLITEAPQDKHSPSTPQPLGALSGEDDPKGKQGDPSGHKDGKACTSTEEDGRIVSVKNTDGGRKGSKSRKNQTSGHASSGKTSKGSVRSNTGTSGNDCTPDHGSSDKASSSVQKIPWNPIGAWKLWKSRREDRTQGHGLSGEASHSTAEEAIGSSSNTAGDSKPKKSRRKKASSEKASCSTEDADGSPEKGATSKTEKGGKSRRGRSRTPHRHGPSRRDRKKKGTNSSAKARNADKEQEPEKITAPPSVVAPSSSHSFFQLPPGAHCWLSCCSDQLFGCGCGVGRQATVG
jgi:hypothetical protein